MHDLAIKRSRSPSHMVMAVTNAVINTAIMSFAPLPSHTCASTAFPWEAKEVVVIIAMSEWCNQAVTDAHFMSDLLKWDALALKFI